MGNQEENQMGRSLNLEDQEIFSTMGNEGIIGNIFGIERIVKEIN